MTTTTSDSARSEAPTARSGGVRTRREDNRSNGQWALGQREPLNHNEEFKQVEDPLAVRTRIEEVYAREGFDAIPGDDLRGRFRWWGLYTQRRPGIDGGQTATLAPEELDDRYFMMRIRIDGGQVSTEQLRVIAGVSQEFGRNTADITDRQNIQLHWVDVADVPEIWRRLESVGLSTTEACGDVPRVILGSPVAGLAKDEVIDPTPAIEAIKREYIGNPEISNLPRKFKTAISWQWDCVPEINDVSFVGVEHPEHGPGFDLLVGGGLSTSAQFAVRLGAWVPLEEIPEVWLGVVKIFRDYGYRRLRNRARLKYLVADWGAEKVRQVLEDEYLHRKLVDGPAAIAPDDIVDHVGVHEQANGLRYVGFSPTVGRVSGDTLAAVADAVDVVGAGKVAFTPLQKLIVTDVAPDRVDDLVDRLGALGLQASPSTWRRNTMACTGIEFCKLAIVDTKQRATDLVAELEDRLADISTPHPVTINVNGCANSCARIQVADIGLKGQIVTDDDGERVPGYQVQLGGHMGNTPELGRKLRGHKVTAAGLGDYVVRVVSHYAESAEAGETFASWSARATDEVLA
ncbi:nitrite/sulfite reductase [Arsenicicoccus piscis]|uniref:assimilatory sulfite reductase (ferredoxin) n=1 Tax=Arsenicicoccus piscis TaxID=673954 RepID=A0ABQ6HRR7_9MICO|nr:nitrite/sulfite reductase [Arsenicicoccus piscis]MCH8626520.1 nitrite/sulfite reductase [Arsenicicoccus piscis]GMA21161.1 ferredoxin--nitrite reductase [Arsenicicoccus piscis]